LLGPDDLAGAPPPAAGSGAGGLAAGAGALVAGLLRVAAGGGGGGGGAAAPALGTPRGGGPPPSALTVGPIAAAARYGLRGREALLLRLDRPAAVVPHAAEVAGDRFPPEALFAAADRLLMDAATAEFVFCADLFGTDGPFNELIGPAIGAVEGWAARLVQATADPVGLLLMIRVSRSHALAMARRAVPALDAYYDRLALALWPRFKGRLDAHADSLAAAGGPGHAAAEPAGVGGRAPHPLAARVAALTGALSTLAADMAEPQVDVAVRRLRSAARGALARLGARLADRGDAAAFVAAQAHFALAAARADAAAAGAAPRPPGGGASTAVAAVGRGGGEEGGGGGGHPLGPAGAAAEDDLARAWGGAAAAWAATAVAARCPALAAAAAAAATAGGAADAGAGAAAAAPFAGGWAGVLAALAADAGRAFRGYPPAAGPAGRAAGEAAIQAYSVVVGGGGGGAGGPTVEEMLVELERLGGGGV
jgi:hypothetical protein